MNRKITLLIVTSILVLIALSSIQAYLINNTYHLKKKAFISETDNAIEIIDNKNELDSLYNLWGDNLKDHIADYYNKRISKQEILRRLTFNADTLNTTYMTFFNSEMDSLNLGYDVKFKMKLKSIVIFNEENIDSIFSNNTNKATKLFGDHFKDENTHIINNSRWFTENEFIINEGDSIKTKTYSLEVKTQNRILIKDWKTIVFKRMSFLFLGALLLFLFVIGLLYFSIKNLITQKRITDIKTDFINNITHELKTPLATLSIATKSLKNETIKTNPKAFTTTLSIIDRQNERLQKLIDQVMTNSLSNEDIVLNKEQVIDNVFFNNLIEDFKLSVQHTNLNIENNVLPAEVLLRIDTFQFTTAILNIMENAVKYGKENITIGLKTELKNRNYYIYISDNGIGISEKNSLTIFDKFYRINEGNIHNVKGLGLGLYYTNQIIKAHNGSISVESELNKGTRFIITIPVN